jgi:hypothetical protein
MHLTNNSITSKQVRLPNDKQFDKIPYNMWYLEQLQEFLNEKFIGTGSPSRSKINEKSNSKSIVRNAASNEFKNIEPIETSYVSGATQQHKSQSKFENELADGFAETKADGRSFNGERKQLKTPDPMKTPQLDKSSKKGTSEQKDVWKTRIEPQLLDILRTTILSSWGYIEWRPGSVGFYGFDIILDSDLRCWLIEVNKCPDMSYSTPITKSLIKSFFEDFAKVIVDRKKDPTSPTGDLELIVEQPFIPEPRELRNNEEYTVKGSQLLNPNDIRRRKSRPKH